MEPTKEQIKLLKACFEMQAYIDVIRPETEAIYNAVLFYMFPPNDLIDKYTGEAITHYNDLYRYEGDCTEYYKEARKALTEAGFTASKPEFCPLLEAESALRDLKREFVKACCDSLPDSIPITFERLNTASLKYYNEFYELSAKYVSQFIN